MSDIALKEHLERRLDDLDRRYEQRFELNELALTKAERSMSDRLAGMNEFREALKDQSSRMITRTEHERLADLVQELRQTHANLEGRLFVLPLLVSGIASIIVSLVVFWITRVGG